MKARASQKRTDRVVLQPSLGIMYGTTAIIHWYTDGIHGQVTSVVQLSDSALLLTLMVTERPSSGSEALQHSAAEVDVVVGPCPVSQVSRSRSDEECAVLVSVTMLSVAYEHQPSRCDVENKKSPDFIA